MKKETGLAIALAAGLTGASCESQKDRLQEHPPLSHTELVERIPPSPDGYSAPLSDGSWLYLREMNGKFLRIPDGHQTQLYLKQLAELRDKATAKASSDKEKTEAQQRYQEKVRRLFHESPDCVRVE